LFVLSLDQTVAQAILGNGVLLIQSFLAFLAVLGTFSMRFDLLALATLAGASTLTPNALPLIVRNPYLSTWLYHARNAPWENWPMFWTGAHVSQTTGGGTL
jgi:hypothetical protein